MNAIDSAAPAAALDVEQDRNSTLLAYARSLIPTLKARVAETVKLGRLPAETIADLEAGGLLSMTTAASLWRPASQRAYFPQCGG